MLTPPEADAAIAARVRLLGVEERPLAALAGRTLAEDVHADRDQPPFDRVAMDGVALARGAWLAGRREFRIAGVQPAGSPPRPLPGPEACIEVMTGASLPPGTDCIVPVERLVVADGVARLAADHEIAPDAHVHARASDLRAGARVLATGTRLGAAEVAVLAAAGRSAARVGRRASIAVVSTGDELVDPGLPLAEWQVRRSNVHGVVAALRLAGHDEVASDHVPDEPAAIRPRLEAHLATRDVVVLSGGVSAGRHDHVPAVLAALGVERVFHGVAQRPGKPLWFGATREGRLVFALPGNPVSTLVCLRRYVLPALARLEGGAPPAAREVNLAAAWRSAPGLTVFLPVALGGAPAAARPRPTNGSGDFHALVGTDGFVELAPGRDWLADASAPYWPWAA